MTARLAGKVGIVTGAGRRGNIGEALCRAFLDAGAKGVIGTDLRRDEAEAIEQALAQAGHADRFRLVEHDVTSGESWAAVVEQALAAFGGIDILVNNAGIADHSGIADADIERVRRVMAVNHDGLLLGMQACLPALSESVTRFPGGGSIINMVSMASYMPNARNIGYSVSKAAARMLTICAAVEFGPRRVRVNSIHPGLTMTPLLREGFEGYVAAGAWSDVTEAQRAIEAMAPLSMTGEPADVAHAAVYLASDESRFVTGASIYHDGGLGQRF